MADSAAMNEVKAAIEALRGRHQRGEVSGDELFRVWKGVPNKLIPTPTAFRTYRGEYATELERAEARRQGRAALDQVTDDAVRELCLALAAEVEVRQELARIRQQAGIAPRRQPGPWNIAFDSNIEQLPKIVQAIAQICCGAGILPQPRVTAVPAGALLDGANTDMIAAIWGAQPDYVLDRAVDAQSIAAHAEQADGGLLFIHDFHRVTPDIASEIADTLVDAMEFRQETLAVAIAADGELLRRMRALSPGFAHRIHAIIERPENA
ncbi:hypothetical protein [Mycobacteroides abscessus]|uniref:hypothetical protein n=1 Tax=Mycobacteroides abscessus TaxID=36809 RepID=UPI00092A5FB4|nr:hypothetical protein [Mycobacteroides abscessus]SHQ48429.1 Uncharacterised protein [Mycobacteroides abscessus subsp. abscessus]SKQ85441.1 Uncharacterised protein [Mycobacteroides abscessus subsp. massiliense]SLC49031.1 Uncharacterised protein [Mycobacteroides abscessus subsp. massiliense]